jgi:hypothetical protein
VLTPTASPASSGGTRPVDRSGRASRPSSSPPSELAARAARTLSLLGVETVSSGVGLSVSENFSTSRLAATSSILGCLGEAYVSHYTTTERRQ